jgi:hypothetical protein
VRLTAAGQTFAGYARTMLGRQAEALAAARSHSEPGHGLLRAAAVTTAAEHVLPPLQERPELQRHGTQLRRVVRQGRVNEVPGEGELAEPRGEHVYLQDRRPGQLPGLQLQAGVELDAVAQPGRRDVVPGDRGVPVGLMVAARDPRIEPQAPQIVLPPRSVAVADGQPGSSPLSALSAFARVWGEANRP